MTPRLLGAMAGPRIAARIAPVLALLIAGCSDAPGGTLPDGDPPNPMAYEIASDDGAVEGWLVGTIHALPPDTRWQTPAISRAIDSADLLVVEVRLGEPAQQRAVMAELATTPGLPPLHDRVPTDLRPQLNALLDRGNVSAETFSDQETWVIALGLAAIDAPGQHMNGVDRAMIADFDDRPVRELEGLLGQLSIFDRLPEPEQRAMLAAVVRESANTRRDPERLQRAWLAGDAATIETSTREGFLGNPALREALLTGRNRRWAAALEPVLKKAPRPLIAVGTAHLVGPDGLVALLETKGYRLRRLP